MIQVLTIVHDCADFTRWKVGYDADSSNRKAAGLTDLVLVRNEAQPNRIALMFEVANLKKAREMVAAPTLSETMRKAGVVGKPEVHFRHGDFTGGHAGEFLTINCRISAMETFRKGFAMDKADRAAAELTEVGVLQDIDDPADLLVVFTVGNRKKADAFLASPTLAEHQVKNAGVVSPPNIRYWRSAEAP